jgi:holo-[acyl-carrier protein] synthase
VDLTSELGQMVSSLLPTPMGVGVDVVDIADFEHLPFEAHRRFYERCFTPTEIAYCRGRGRPAEHFAARFAAKEAAVKALSGSVTLAYWQTEVDRGADGAPHLKFWNSERTAALEELRNAEVLVTLSHSQAVAAAVVVVYRKGP